MKLTEQQLARIASSTNPVMGGSNPAGRLVAARVAEVVSSHALNSHVDFGDWGGNEITRHDFKDCLLPGSFLTKEIWGGNSLPFVVRITRTPPELAEKVEHTLAAGLAVI